MKPFNSPLLEALIKHRSTMQAGFHVPGHHYGEALRSWPASTNPLTDTAAKYFKPIMEIDVTELASTDDLHHPEASILEAQQLAAQSFGTEETFFLIGGSTSGNLALILTICDRDDVVIVQRNVHKSIINGLKLAGAQAVFVSPEYETSSGIATVPSIIYIQEAIARYPHAKAIILSTPNYYGVGTSMTSYVELAHQHGIPLLIDEAHGAHYGLHPSFPSSAIAAGADAVVQSAHKTLPTLTMGAMLHVQNDLIDREELKQALATIQSSSPSFPILASIDISRAMIDALGPDLFRQSLDSMKSLRQFLKENAANIVALDAADEDYTYDPLRIVLYDRTSQLSGFELQQKLQERGCWIEMADSRYAVLLFGIQTSAEDVAKLQAAIMEIDRSIVQQNAARELQHNVKLPIIMLNDTPMISEPVSFKKETYKHRETERVRLDEAEGRLAAEMVVPYPPGIPMLYQGERISSASIEQCRRLSEDGAKFQGAQDGTMQTISVYK